MILDDIRLKTMRMVDRVYEILFLVEKGFMDQKNEPLAEAMKKENELNEMEKDVTKSVLEFSKSNIKADERKELALFEQIAETLERMGDEAAGLVERIEIKVHENLLFSDLGVGQFNETFNAMKKSVEMMREFLNTRNNTLKERVIDNGFHVKELVERYRKEHTERLVKGICSPMAANMYFDMLDFTGNLARHSSNIVKLF